MSDKNRRIVFYDDCYDSKRLIWKAGKKYKIIAESKDLYFCECEPVIQKKRRWNNRIDKLRYRKNHIKYVLYYIKIANISVIM